MSISALDEKKELENKVSELIRLDKSAIKSLSTLKVKQKKEKDDLDKKHTEQYKKLVFYLHNKKTKEEEGENNKKLEREMKEADEFADQTALVEQNKKDEDEAERISRIARVMDNKKKRSKSKRHSDSSEELSEEN